MWVMWKKTQMSGESCATLKFGIKVQFTKI